MKRTIFAAALGVVALTLAAPASAQGRYGVTRVPYGYGEDTYVEARRIAYENGYREGLKEGRKESRKGDVASYRDEKTFRRAKKGYHRRYGNPEAYQRSFREGYADGYADAYRGRRGGWGRRDDRGGWGDWGDWGRLPRGPRDRDRDRDYGYGDNSAFQNGARDGHEKGREDARERRSPDVLRHKWYRSADRDYDDRFGSRRAYANEYRQGFRQGYEQGYYEGRRW